MVVAVPIVTEEAIEGVVALGIVGSTTVPDTLPPLIYVERVVNWPLIEIDFVPSALCVIVPEYEPSVCMFAELVKSYGPLLTPVPATPFTVNVELRPLS
jgi:hypothetical protein